ncbi:ribosomal-protein-alanine N-acetyltransferase [Herbinix hemicellulosilytica]|uniref:[Ribosomal protein bS18]-alanine N-acetyltransferase n=1 Tax=Herbinix hemicellulosilytica TaxID=1564487 RepID=A0A0H5SK20_HERHM|nr:ribosomal protein S18-alanine N-acetyltransferase [Herbinix hemicellulosilytica]RBP56912.1 ribosomal-protein-alanine N-acetyltransferase [Herbinix hemicellulosilytica]CRZ35450.1 hypothetical protein HHT355_2261 [Herbinix hemicellulosilytica]
MLVRKMEESDLEEVCTIEKETFSEPWSKAAFIESLSGDNNHFFVVDIEGTIAGYCGYYEVAGEGYICNVAVRTNFRRQGIGYKMLKELIRHTQERGIYSLTLEVRKSNLPAINLYKKLGFVEAGLRKDFYTKPTEDAIIMWRNDIH